jgi:hypothetical protein
MRPLLRPMTAPRLTARPDGRPAGPPAHHSGHQRVATPHGIWAAPRFPDSGIGAISCCTLPVQVLVVNFLRSPVAER